MLEDFAKDLVKAIFLMIQESGIKKEWLMFSGDANKMVMELMKNLWNYLAIIGVALTLIYFLIEMNTKLALEGAQNMTMKSFMSPFLKLGIAIVILCNGANITLTLLSVNDGFVTWAETAHAVEEGEEDEYSQVGDSMDEAIEDMNIFECAFIVLILLLIYIISAILSLVWMYKAVCYKLEVLYRLGITPVALADVYSGNHSNALRWLKGFIGLALYAVAIMLLPRIAMLLGAGMLTTALADSAGVWEIIKAMGCLLVAPFAAIGVAGTVKQTCKEALG